MEVVKISKYHNKQLKIEKKMNKFAEKEFIKIICDACKSKIKLQYCDVDGEGAICCPVCEHLINIRTFNDWVRDWYFYHHKGSEIKLPPITPSNLQFGVRFGDGKDNYKAKSCFDEIPNDCPLKLISNAKDINVPNKEMVDVKNTTTTDTEKNSKTDTCFQNGNNSDTSNRFQNGNSWEKLKEWVDEEYKKYDNMITDNERIFFTYHDEVQKLNFLTILKDKIQQLEEEKEDV